MTNTNYLLNMSREQRALCIDMARNALLQSRMDGEAGDVEGAIGGQENARMNRELATGWCARLKRVLGRAGA